MCLLEIESKEWCLFLGARNCITFDFIKENETLAKWKKKKNSWSLQRQLIGIQPVNHKIQSYNTEQDPTIFFCCWFKSCYLYINLYSHNKDTPLYILSGFGFFAFNYSHIHQIRVLERRSNPSSCFEIWFTY